jgi:hypothetical protein
LFALISIHTLSFAQSVVSNNNCNELYLTEITIGKAPNTNNNFDLNYAIEIFNPTNGSINLSNYSIELSYAIGTVSNFPLNGTLASHDIYILGSSLADLNLQGLCDQLNINFDLGSAVSLELKKSGKIIDKFGIGGISVPINFDVSQFTADPFNYLATYHLDVNDFNNIDLQRSHLTYQGNPNFNASTDIIGEWEFHLNTDRSNLGSYKGPCNMATGDCYLGFKNNLSSVDPCGLFGGSNIDPLDIVLVSGSPVGQVDIAFDAISSSTTANVGPAGTSNLTWAFCNSCTYSSTSIDIANLAHDYLVAGQNLSFLNREAYWLLSSISLGCGVDNSKSTHRTHVMPCALTEIDKNIVSKELDFFFINETCQMLVNSKGNYSYKVVSMTGSVLLQGEVQNESSKIDCSTLIDNVYLIIFTNSKNIITKKFVKIS